MSIMKPFTLKSQIAGLLSAKFFNINSVFIYDKSSSPAISEALFPAVLFAKPNHCEISVAVMWTGCDLSKIKLLEPIA